MRLEMNIFFLTFYFLFGLSLTFDPEDADLTAPQLIEKHKYPVEIHNITSKGGYVLQMHRIPHGKNSQPNGRSVIISHGQLGSSDGFILLGPKKALAFVLADEGYDVWLGNTRGNIYSRKNDILSPETSEYWDFDWEEISTIDLPTIIEYILKKTGNSQVDIIGHSEGATTPLILLSKKPEYEEKIRTLISIAPIGFNFHSTSIPFRTLCTAKIFIPLTLFGYYDGAPKSDIAKDFASTFCIDDDSACQNFYESMFGFSSDQIEKGFFDILAGHYPSGTSIKQIVHQCQLFFIDAFQKYDYGLFGNLKKYNTKVAPPYDLSKVKQKVFILYSDKDAVTTISDIKTLTSKLPKSESHLIEDFNHLDWLFGTRAADEVYSKIKEILNAN